MKLHQLRYLVSIVENDLNITAASIALHTVQPGVSKQIQMLEAELGFKIFVRRGKMLTRMTPAGESVLARAREILREIEEIRSVAAELRNDEKGTFVIATTHTQARYVLPGVLQEFRRKVPGVNVHLHQGDSEQIAAMLARDRIDLAVETDNHPLFSDLVRVPCFRWRRVLIAPQGHPLTTRPAPSLADVAAFPLITYSSSITGPGSLLELFEQEGLSPEIALSAHDADVIKTYVRKGLGVGIVEQLAMHPLEDSDLVVVDAGHLLPESTTWVGFRRGALLRRYVYDFIHLLAPQLNRRDICKIELLPNQAAVQDALHGRDMPLRAQPNVPLRSARK